MTKPYRSACKCGCHKRPGMLHTQPCCQPDPTNESTEPSAPLPDGMVSYGPKHADYPNQPSDWDESGDVYVDWGEREFEIMADEPRFLKWSHAANPGQDQGNIIGYSRKSPQPATSREAVINSALMAELDRQAKDSVAMPYVGDPWGDPEEIILDGTFDMTAIVGAIAAALAPAPADVRPVNTAQPLEGKRKFQIGDRVTKTKGSSWTGLVVGSYSTSLTPEGYAVESENEPGSVQIYPASALASKGGVS